MSVPGIVAVWKGEGWCVVLLLLLVELFLKGFSRGKCVVVVVAVEAEVVVMALFEPERRAFLPSTVVIFMAPALVVAAAAMVTVVEETDGPRAVSFCCPFTADPDICPSNVLLL